MENKKMVMETYKNLTALVLSDCSICEEAVEGLHQALAYELAEHYMLEHGYKLNTDGNFIEEQRTMIF